MRDIVAVTLSVLISAAAVPTGAGAAPYSLSVISVPGAVSTHASGPNNAGQISGTYTDVNNASHAFLDINGTFGFFDVPGSIGTSAFGINAAGQVTGNYTDATNHAHGFFYSSGVFTTIDPPGSFGTFPQAINDSGQVTGYYSTALGSRSFLDTNGTFTMIAVPGASSTTAFGINNAGQIVGSYRDSAGTHGFVDTNGTFTSVDVPAALEATPSPDAPPLIDTVVFSINNLGQLAGNYGDYNGSHAFVDTTGAFTVFNAPGVPANSTNAPLIVPQTINDAGQIDGYYQLNINLGSGESADNGFFANPIGGTAVPEPASAALLGAGMASLALVRRRRSGG